MKCFSLHAQNQNNRNVFLTLTLSKSLEHDLYLFGNFCSPTSESSLSTLCHSPLFFLFLSAILDGKDLQWRNVRKTIMIPSAIHETKNCPQTGKDGQVKAFIYWILSQALPNIRLFKPYTHTHKKLFFEGFAFGRFMELFPFIQLCWKPTRKNSKLRYISY